MNQLFRKQQNARPIYILNLILLGFIVFSPISSFITINLLHFPISFPEILLVLFLPFCRKHFQFTTLLRKQTFFVILVWMFLIAIALLLDKFSLYSILSTARSYLYLIIFYLLFNKNNNISIEAVYYICLGTFGGWILDAFISFKTYTLNGLGTAVSYGPMLCIPIIIGFQILKGKYKSLIIMILLSIFLMIIAGMRRQMLVTVISLLIMFLYVAKRNKVNFIKLLLAGVFVSVIISSNFNVIGELIKSHSSELYFRVITKSELFLKGEENEGDETRKEIIKNFANETELYLFPRGFVSKQTATDKNTGFFNDLPIMELSYSLGILGTLLLIIYFGYSAYRCYILSNKNTQNEIYFIYTLSFITMFTLLFLEGSFLTFPYAVTFTGYCLGSLHRYSGIRFVTKKTYK